MDLLTGGLSPGAFAAALAITLFGGITKGLVGFALPLIMVAGLAGFLPHEVVIIAVLIPILVTNLQQALRDGLAPAQEVTRDNARLIAAMVAMLLLSTQLVRFIPADAALLVLGIPIVLYAGVQLAGVPLRLPIGHRNRAQWMSGAMGGLYGGLSGVWGPPLVVYLLSMRTEKRVALRTQGVLFLLGSIVALAGHAVAGNLTMQALVLSAVLTVPAVVGTMIGDRLLDRVDQDQFRKFSQLLLVVVGLNLIRQAVS